MKKAELAAEVERLRELNHRQSLYLEELRKPVQEHCRIWHLPALRERDEAKHKLEAIEALLPDALHEKGGVLVRPSAIRAILGAKAGDAT